MMRLFNGSHPGRNGMLGLALSFCLAGASCSKNDADDAARRSSDQPRRGLAASDAQAPAPVLDVPGLQTPGMPPTLSEADKAWLEVVKASRQPAPPAAWTTNEPSAEAIHEWNRSNSLLAGEAAEKARDFYTRYPEHAQAADARATELHLLRAAVELGNTNQLARLSEVENARLKDPALGEEERFDLRVAQVQRAAMRHDSEGADAVYAAFERGVRELQQEFPKRPETYSMLLEVAQNSEPAKARALAQELSATTAPEEIQTEAKGLLTRLDALGKPLNVRFAAVDGRDVDLAKLKGKVVLVDFWATWCVTCLQELPHLKAAYERLHGQGFEVVGISFDDDKDALTRFIASERIPWPQYFEAGGNNRFSREFQVTALPTMWLVDKKGVLRELNAQEDLVGKVEKLLAEAP